MADEQTADFFNPPAEAPPGGDEPIIMMPAGDAPEFAAAPPPEDFIGDVDAAANNAPAVLVPDDAGDMGFAAPVDSGAAVLVEDVGDEDPDVPPEQPEELSPMTKWNNEWQVILSERKDAENAEKAKQIEEARIELEKFQAAREAKRESKMARNRSEEQDKLEAIEADLENDNSWQRTVKMVELTHDTAEESADVGRMRDVLIHLKNDPERATMLTA